MFNANLLRAALAEIGMKIPQLAERLGITPSALSRKMNGERDFFRSEIQTVAELVGWEKANAIFFG